MSAWCSHPDDEAFAHLECVGCLRHMNELADLADRVYESQYNQRPVLVADAPHACAEYARLIDRHRHPSILDPSGDESSERAAVAADPRPGTWFGDLDADGRGWSQEQTDLLIRCELWSIASQVHLLDQEAELAGILGEDYPFKGGLKSELWLRAFPGEEWTAGRARPSRQRGGVDSDPLVRLLAWRAWGDRDRRWFEERGVRAGDRVTATSSETVVLAYPNEHYVLGDALESGRPSELVRVRQEFSTTDAFYIRAGVLSAEEVRRTSFPFTGGPVVMMRVGDRPRTPPAWSSATAEEILHDVRGTREGIATAVYAVAGVEAVEVHDRSTLASLTDNQVAVFVTGGEDYDIARAIYGSAPAGLELLGDHFNGAGAAAPRRWFRHDLGGVSANVTELGRNCFRVPPHHSLRIGQLVRATHPQNVLGPNYSFFLPNGIVQDTIYYAIPHSRRAFAVASSRANAFADHAVQITSGGMVDFVLYDHPRLRDAPAAGHATPTPCDGSYVDFLGFRRACLPGGEGCRAAGCRAAYAASGGL